MSHVVAKPFNTESRRLKAGAPVAETDDLAPHAFADLKARGFVRSTAQPAAPAHKAPEAAPSKRPFVARGEE